MEEVNKLEINKFYQTLFQNSLPKEIMLLDKNKRKIIKRKVKQKCLKDTYKNFVNKLKDLNKNTITNNFEINELEINDDNEINSENKLDLNLNDICIKIIDFGNAEHMDKREQETIYTRVIDLLKI